jgi:hypothetical protein
MGHSLMNKDNGGRGIQVTHLTSGDPKKRRQDILPVFIEPVKKLASKNIRSLAVENACDPCD